MHFDRSHRPLERHFARCMPNLHNAHLAFMPLRHSSGKLQIPNVSLNQEVECITRSEWKVHGMITHLKGEKSSAFLSYGIRRVCVGDGFHVGQLGAVFVHAGGGRCPGLGGAACE